MKEVLLAKADPLGEQEVENTVIHITMEISELRHLGSMKDSENFYDAQAGELVGALFDSLPQGTLDRVLIGLMKRKVSLYRGKTIS